MTERNSQNLTHPEGNSQSVTLRSSQVQGELLRGPKHVQLFISRLPTTK